MAVEESSVPGSGMQQERLFTLLCLSAAKGWLFPPFQLLSASKERIFLIFSTQKRLLPGRGKAHPDAPSSRAENREMEAERGKPGCPLG